MKNLLLQQTSNNNGYLPQHNVPYHNANLYHGIVKNAYLFIILYFTPTTCITLSINRALHFLGC